LHFQYQITNVCVFLLINKSLNDDKELSLTINHRSPRTKRYANYAFKTGIEGVFNSQATKTIYKGSTLV
jgi:hypothetical protein